MPMTHVCLLRGINVGGRHKLPMADLVKMFEAAGCRDVRHYIQSGNVVFSAGRSVAAAVPGTVGRAIFDSFGFDAPLILRTASAFTGIIHRHPFVEICDDPRQLFVGFLADRPTAGAVRRMDPSRSPHDRMEVHGGEIYLMLTKGVSGSRLTSDWLDRTLNTTCTVRNWQTVNRLAAMLASV